MRGFYNRIERLLGRSGEDAHLLLSALNDEPIVDFEDSEHRLLILRNSGLHVHVLKDPEYIYSISFHIATAATESGEMNPYCGNLLNGITVRDTRPEVHHKMGSKPSRSEMVPGYCDPQTCDKYDAWDYWELHRPLLTVVSNANKLKALTISAYQPADQIQI